VRERLIYLPQDRMASRLWDVHALLSCGPSWKQFLPVQIDGRAPLEVDGMTRRMEEVLNRSLRRL
jgi:hypothetical protein